MKRNIFFISIMVAVIITSCDKTSVSNLNRPMTENYATMGESSSKESGKPIEITYSVGHDISECNGCIYINGELGHADCQGFGDACVIRIRLWPIGGQATSTPFSAVVDTLWDVTSEDYYNMPDRSLNYIDEKNNRVFLNIPAQMIFRDSVTRQFTFTGLYITNSPAYSND